MAKRKLPPKMWVYAPRAAPKAKVPEAVKTEVSQQGQGLIDEWKPQYVTEPLHLTAARLRLGMNPNGYG